ncbi:pyruvate synthase subunit PorD [Halanaerobaculum tunisiense]
MVEAGDGYKDIPKGGLILEAGNAKKYKTGGWRTKRPLLNNDKCINCHLCWIFCPDSAVVSEDEEVTGFDYDHCKGCGICAYECPVNAIEMDDE